MNTLVEKNILSVSALNAQCKKTLETTFPQIWVEGEISNFINAGSGHWYFTLKDSRAQIRCAMFKFKNSKIKFKPENGMQVILRAKLTLYEPRGDYQLICEHIELAGDGKLLKEYERLKQKLSLEGLFDQQYKKALPEFPKTIGIISSADGAAVHDILQVLKRRAPTIEVILYPSLVQGTTAAIELIQSLSYAIQESSCDILIIGRGGGSLEDLQAFNNEQLARDISLCPIPIISAVGHEIDFTICDFVADIRAATPSVAAEIASPDEQQWFEWLEQIKGRLFQLINTQLKHKNNELAWLAKQLKHPSSKLDTIRQKLDELSYRQEQAIRLKITNKKHQLDLQIAKLQQYQPNQQLKLHRDKLEHLYQQLSFNMLSRLKQQQLKLNTSVQKLEVLSPLAIMSRGYAMVSDAHSNKLIKSKKETAIGSIIKVRFASDHIYAKVLRDD
ncbi:MAG: exodeoxyribonuclease VII large subunit [Pseudomonadota bacterium]